MHALKIYKKSGTEISISITVRVPHDVVRIPDIVVDVECKAGDWTRKWLQWSWKDVWKLVINKWTCYRNIRRTQSRQVSYAAVTIPATGIKHDSIIINHCKQQKAQNSLLSLLRSNFTILALSDFSSAAKVI